MRHICCTLSVSFYNASTTSSSTRVHFCNYMRNYSPPYPIPGLHIRDWRQEMEVRSAYSKNVSQGLQSHAPGVYNNQHTISVSRIEPCEMLVNDLVTSFVQSSLTCQRNVKKMQNKMKERKWLGKVTCFRHESHKQHSCVRATWSALSFEKDSLALREGVCLAGVGSVRG